MHEELIAKAAERIRQRTARETEVGHEPYCVLALFDADDYPTASTVTAAWAEGIARLYFDTSVDGNKVQRIQRNPRASVCFSDAAYNITLVGTAEVRTDAETKQAMWFPGMADHFSGPDDPDYCVIAFTTERYNLLVDWKEAAGILGCGIADGVGAGGGVVGL